MKLIFPGLLALLAWVPLPLGSNRPWAGAIMIILACLLAGGAVLAWARQRIELAPALKQARWAIALGTAWLLYIGLQSLALPAEWVLALSPHAHEAQRLAAEVLGRPIPEAMSLSLDVHATQAYGLRVLAYAIVFCLVLQFVDTRRRLELLLATLVFSGVAQATYGSLMTLSGMEYGFFVPKAFGQGTATGTFVNRNHLAGYLNLCLAAGVGLMLARLGGEAASTWRQRLRSLIELLLGEKTRLRIYLIVMVIGLVLTRSRMGNTAFFAGTLVVGTLGLLLMRNAPRSTMLFLASLIALDVIIIGAWFGVDQVVNRVTQTEVRADAEQMLPTEDRDEVAKMAWHQARDFLPLGSGAGSFDAVFPGYANESVMLRYEHAHNDYLQVLAETGVVGAICCCGIVLLAAWQALAAMRRRNDPLMRGTAFGASLAICWLLIHSAVDFNMQIPANALTMSAMLALAWVASTLREDPQPDV